MERLRIVLESGWRHAKETEVLFPRDGDGIERVISSYEEGARPLRGGRPE